MTNEEQLVYDLMVALRSAYEREIAKFSEEHKHMLESNPQAPIIQGNLDQTVILRHIKDLLRIINFVRNDKLKVQKVEMKDGLKEPPPPEVQRQVARDLSWALKGAAKATKAVFKPETEESKARLEVCKACPEWTGKSCKVCGCFVNLKVRIPEEKCPIGKW
jgi:hypothetical protein